MIATGNKILSEVDLAAGVLPLTRSYSMEALAQSTGFGPNWTWSFGQRLILEGNPNWAGWTCEAPGDPAMPCPHMYNSITVVKPDGTHFKYTYDTATQRYEDSRPTSTSWIREVLLPQPHYELVLERQDGSHERYNHNAQLVSTRNDQGVGYNFTYTTGYLTGVQHTSGPSISISWGPGGIQSITAPNNKVFNYSYTNGRLTGVTYPDGLGTKTYHYEDPAHPGALTGYSVNGQRRTRYSYYADGRVRWSGREGGTERDTFAYGSNWTDMTNALGHTVRYNFATVNGVNRITSVNSPATTACPGGNQVTSFDARGYRQHVIDFEGNKTEFTYDDRGFLQKTIAGIAPNGSHAQALRTEYVWDVQRGLLLRERYFGTQAGSDPVREVEYVYFSATDPLRRRLASHVSICSPSCSASDADKRTTQFAYTFHPNREMATQVIDGPLAGPADTVTLEFDTFGRAIKVTNALGHTQQFLNYNGLGQPQRVIDANGLNTYFSYDAKGRRTRTRVAAPGGDRIWDVTYRSDDQVSHVQDPSGNVVTYVYSAIGRLARIWQPSPHPYGSNSRDEIRFGYNDLSQITQVQQGYVADGVFTVVQRQRHQYDTAGYRKRSYGNNGQETLYQYDANGRLAGTENALGRTNVFLYDTHGRLKTQFDALNQPTHFGYDVLGRLSAVTDPKNNTTTYAYNGFGDLVSRDSPDSGVTTFTYDAMGLPKSMTRQGGLTTTYTRDVLGRATAMSAARPSGGVDTRGFLYDTCGPGRLCRIDDGWGSEHFRYNQDGQLNRQFNSRPGEANIVMEYFYDAVGRPREVLYHSGVRARYHYDSASNVERVQVQIGATAAWQDVVRNVRWQPMGGGITSLEYGNGHQRTQEFDWDGRITRILTPNVQHNQLTYNTVNEIVQLSNSGHGSLLNESYDYDDLGRLTETQGTYPQVFGYDANGNRTSHLWDGKVSTYTVPPDSNRLNHLQRTGNDGRNYNNDVRGNRATESANGVVAQFGYDGFNRLESMSRPSPATACRSSGVCQALWVGEARYEHNGLGQRVSKRLLNSNGVQQRYQRYSYLPGGQLAQETNTTGTALSKRYIWLGGMPIGLVQSSTLYYVHTDHLNRPESITDSSQARVWRSEPHPFDSRVYVDQIGGFNLGLPGQYYDSESGYWYNHHRTYDPHTGRYTQSDPIGLAGGLNTYAYVGGNPVSFVDSLGLARVDLSNGFTGRVDTFNYGGNASFEIHVYDPRGAEVGVYGPDGWINKHGHKGAPNGLPDGVEAQCKTVSDDYSRRTGITARRASQGASRLKSIFKGWPFIGPLIEMTAPSPNRICDQIPDYPGCEAM